MAKVKKLRERSIVKGALAGLVGGIAGHGAKTLAEKTYPAGVDEAVSAGPAGRPWILGALAGAVYGAAVEIEPKAGAWCGAGFGLALNRIPTGELFGTGTPRSVALATTVRQQTQERQSRWVSHAVFGIATEIVRRIVRRGL